MGSEGDGILISSNDDIDDVTVKVGEEMAAAAEELIMLIASGAEGVNWDLWEEKNIAQRRVNIICHLSDYNNHIRTLSETDQGSRTGGKCNQDKIKSED